MDSFKFTSWNIKHSRQLLDQKDSEDAEEKRHARARLLAIKDVITRCNPDILLFSEAPNLERRAREFFDIVAPNYTLVARPGATGKDYGMQGGTQWIWFLIKKGTPIRGKLQTIDHWQSVVERASKGAHRSGEWDVSFPEYDATSKTLEFQVTETWSHYRHPQVLMAEIDGHALEIVGCHLRSKHTSTRFNKADVDDETFFSKNEKLVAELVSDRVKLVTECIDIRHYIESRFEEDTDAAVLVAGDLNDGPGKERIERRFMYQDLVAALQGDVFFARRFMNHALFDTPQDERWSYYLDDTLDRQRSNFVLLDHILFSQAMTRSHTGQKFPYLAEAGTGLVEHKIFHQVASDNFKYATPSDHRPISMTFKRPWPS